MKVDNITLMMFVLNFVEFCFIRELIYSSDFHEGRQLFHVDACVEFCFLNNKYAIIYFITTVTSQVHSARHHQRAGYSALPSV